MNVHIAYFFPLAYRPINEHKVFLKCQINFSKKIKLATRKWHF